MTLIPDLDTTNHVVKGRVTPVNHGIQGVDRVERPWCSWRQRGIVNGMVLALQCTVHTTHCVMWVFTDSRGSTWLSHFSYTFHILPLVSCMVREHSASFLCGRQQPKAMLGWCGFESQKWMHAKDCIIKIAPSVTHADVAKFTQTRWDWQRPVES